MLPPERQMLLTLKEIAEISLLGTAFVLLGGCYLAYDLLGGKQGPLRGVARATGYLPLFFIGYAALLGVAYAAIAASGMGVLLAVEFQVASMTPVKVKPRRIAVLMFGILRGAVLGLAGMTAAGFRFGLLFGALSGLGLCLTYLFGFAPTDDYEVNKAPRFSGHNLQASVYRAVAIGAAGGLASVLITGPEAIAMGLALGAAAGVVSAVVGLFSPLVEWVIGSVSDRRLGVAGLCFIFIGTLLQSGRDWLEILSLPIH